MLEFSSMLVPQETRLLCLGTNHGVDGLVGMLLKPWK